MDRWIKRHGTSNRLGTLLAYMTTVAIIGIAAAVRILATQPLPDTRTVLLYLALGMIGGHLQVQFPGGYFTTAGSQVAFAALWSFGSPLAALCLVPPALMKVFTEKRAVVNSTFNAGQFTLSLVAAGWLTQTLSSIPGFSGPLGRVLTVFLMVFIYDMVNGLFVAIALSIDRDEPLPLMFSRICLTQRKNSLVIWYLVNMASAHLASHLGEVGVLFVFAGTFALWAQMKFEQELVRKSVEAQTDVLTGLYNLRYLEDWLSKDFPRLAHQTDKCSLVFVDVDGLKEVNDTLGHDAGDAVLVHLAKVLKSVIRGEDRVVRYGGDEFILICAKADMNEASGIGRRVLEAIERTPATHQGIPLSYGISLGVASFPKHSTFGRDLVRMADKAMYLAKKNGGNTVYTADSL